MPRNILLIALACWAIGFGAYAQTTTADAVYAKSVGGVGAASYDAQDLVENVKFATVVAIDFTTKTVKADSGPVLAIDARGVSPVDGVAVSLTAYGVTITSKTKAAVKYALSGTLAGTLTLSSDTAYQLYLNGLTVKATDGPAFNLQSKQRAYIVLADGTVNNLSDTSNRVKDLDLKAALYAKGRIILSGNGSLAISANYKHGLYSADTARLRAGTIKITVSARDGIRTDNGFVFDDGNLTIVGTGTVTDEESKGIKVDGSEKSPGQGQIVINGGYITITSVGKGISAGWDIDEDAGTAATTDDPNPDLIVNNGIINIVTTGTPYERTNADGTVVSCSPEGLEAKSDLVINGGWITIKTADDCLNAGASITINSGYIYAIAIANDAIDSNGSLTIAGGVVVAVGGREPEGPFDCDMNTFAVTGGTIIGIGGTTSQPTTKACTQNVLIAGSYAKGVILGIKAKDGATVLSYTLPADAPTIVVSTPTLKTSTEYSIYTGGTATGGSVFYGLSTGAVRYSGGTVSKTFTPTTSVTQSGGQIFNMGPGGQGGPGGQPMRDGQGFRGGRGGTRPDGMVPPDGWTPPDGGTPPKAPATTNG